jgi:hypothetical protein
MHADLLQLSNSIVKILQEHAVEAAPVVRLEVAYDSLVARLNPGRHVWRQVVDCGIVKSDQLRQISNRNMCAAVV